jgi:hypothetical protein
MIVGFVACILVVFLFTLAGAGDGRYVDYPREGIEYLGFGPWWVSTTLDWYYKDAMGKIWLNNVYRSSWVYRVDIPTGYDNYIQKFYWQNLIKDIRPQKGNKGDYEW